MPFSACLFFNSKQEMTHVLIWQEALFSAQVQGRPETVHIWPAILCTCDVFLLLHNFAQGAALGRKYAFRLGGRMEATS